MEENIQQNLITGTPQRISLGKNALKSPSKFLAAESKNIVFEELEELDALNAINFRVVDQTDKENSFNFSMKSENFLDKSFLKLLNSPIKNKSRSNSSDFSELGRGVGNIKKNTQTFQRKKSEIEAIESPRRKKNTELFVASPSRNLLENKINKELYFTPTRKEEILRNLSAFNTPDKNSFFSNNEDLCIEKKSYTQNINPITLLQKENNNEKAKINNDVNEAEENINRLKKIKISEKEKKLNDIKKTIGEIKTAVNQISITDQIEINSPKLNKNTSYEKIHEEPSKIENTEKLEEKQKENKKANNISSGQFSRLSNSSNSNQSPPSNSNFQTNNCNINLNYHYNNNFMYFNQESNFTNHVLQLKKMEIAKTQSSLPIKTELPSILEMQNLQGLGFEEMSDYYYFLAKDHNGYRYLQTLMDQNPATVNGLMFRKIKSKIKELMNDPYGNYFIQKLYIFLDDSNLESLISIIQPNFLNIATNSHGTRSLQKLVEFLRNEKLVELFVHPMKNILIELIKDMNSTHVIIKFLSLFPLESNFIFEEIITNCLDIASDKFGCIVFQKCIEVSEENNKKALINLILQNCFCLITDEFGNYVIQYIISMKNQELIKRILFSMIDYLVILCKQKYSSNVIERIFEHSEESIRDLLISKIANQNVIENLMFDLYGNYIVQKALSLSKEPYYSVMINSIVPLMDKLRRVSFGSKLYQKFMTNYPEINFLVSKRMNSTIVNYPVNPNYYMSQNTHSQIQHNPYMYYYNNQIPNNKK